MSVSADKRTEMYFLYCNCLIGSFLFNTFQTTGYIQNSEPTQTVIWTNLEYVLKEYIIITDIQQCATTKPSDSLFLLVKLVVITY